MPTTYKLATIRDLFEQLPADRVEACLLELIDVVKQAQAVRDLVNAAGAADGYDPQFSFPDFVEWTDDGDESCTINLMDGVSTDPVITFATRVSK